MAPRTTKPKEEPTTPESNVVPITPDTETTPRGLSSEQLAELRRPFPFNAIRYKPQAVNNRDNPTKALVTFYLDARLVAERLNEVVGPEGWSQRPAPVCAENAQSWAALHFPVVCELTVGGVTKVDVGTYQASKPDDKAVKSAYSDSLKRAGVLFGIGVYLYGGIPDLWAGVEVGNNKKVRGFSAQGKKQIEQHYTKALAQLEDRFGKPLGHGLEATTSDETDVDPEPNDEPEPTPAAAATKPDPDDPLVTKERFNEIVALAKSVGLTTDAIKKAVEPEYREHGGYRTSFMDRQEAYLNTMKRTGGDAGKA